MKLNVGAGEYRSDGWVNIDVPGTPYDVDLIADVCEGLPYADRTASKVYLGHVLEHVEWDRVPVFLDEIRRVSDGRVMVVGPDIERVLDQWKAGVVPRGLLDETLEGDGVHMTDRPPWPGARHAWNCTEARVLRVMRDAGFERVRSWSDDLGAIRADGWPLVSGVDWQFGTEYR